MKEKSETNMGKLYKEYCTGCGLCHSLYGVKFQMSESGFLEPEIVSDECESKLKNICPCYGKQCGIMHSSDVWGREEGLYTAYSSDEYVRYSASSGGVLTQLCIFLLKEKLVDGILHVGKDENNPIGCKLYCSTTAEQVIKNCGSRYISSAPLYNIKEYIEETKKYAFIGKPCDIAAVRNWMRINSEIGGNIKYLLSFFCAGAPSEIANIRLLNKMGCNLDECVQLTYRGNGWPGYATAIDVAGKKHEIPYKEAWGQTLGRDIRKICRFCIDGLGEMADISCGDAWYLDADKKPSFDENKGRNVVFCRTKLGADIFLSAVKAGYIKLDDYSTIREDLKYLQYHQFFKKSTMYSSIMALQICGRQYPRYDKKKMNAYSAGVDKKLMLKKFLGTVKRIMQGKI